MSAAHGFWRQACARLRTAAHGDERRRVLLALIMLACLLLPLLSPYDYFTPHYELLSRRPMLAGGHMLGTDPLGRDLLVRVMWGCRISLAVGLAASLVSVLIGVAWGATAGYAGGSPMR